MIEAGLEQGRSIVVEQRPAGVVALGDLLAPRMALGANLVLLAGERGRRLAGGDVLQARAPAAAAALVELNGQALVRLLLAAAGPAQVLRSGTVAGLAAHADLRPAGGEAIAFGVVVLAQVGGVAIRAHEVPVLCRAGPVQRIGVADLLFRIEMEPALSALIRRPAVPGDGQGLQTAVRKLHQILLQGFDAEGVADAELGQLAVGAVGKDEEAPIATVEA
ncbi:hypothetical protein D3C78_1236320 [compost metagenome]